MIALARLGSMLAAAVVAAIGISTQQAAPAPAADPYQVLVFSKTAGFRHDSIPAGIQAIRELGTANGFTVTATEDSAVFTTSQLANYKAVVFLSTTGDVLNASQQTAMESYINGGGGYAGIHAAADTEYDWPFYGQLVGAWFRSHPAIQQVTTKVADRAHPATSHLGQTWVRTDELYNYRTNPRPAVRVLSTLDETTYTGGDMGDHPITWCHPQGSGRSFYTGFGHTIGSYTEAAFRTQLLGGIRYAAGVAKADCRAETGYTTTYNGATTGWSQAGTGGFSNSDATLTSTGGTGNFWYSAKQYGSYSLKLDWRLTGDADSGVFVGFPSSDPVNAGAGGYEVNIDASDTADRTTGAVYGAKGANIAARDAALNPPGSWNTYELLVEGERLRVYLNGSLINDFTNTNPARSLTDGYIGLQNNGTGIAFRNVRVHELGGPAPTQVEGEAFTSQFGVQVAGHAAASGGQTLGYIDNGDWAGYSQVSTAARTSFSARISSGGPGGTLQVRSGSATGPVLGSVAIPATGSWDTFQQVSTTLAGSTGGTVFLTFSGGTGSLFDVDYISLS
jgi:type 1 glutamine amidotransferase